MINRLLCILALCSAAIAQTPTILVVGNSLGVQLRNYEQRDFPLIPTSAWINGLSFDSYTCQSVLVQLPQLLAWVQRSQPDPVIIINFFGEDDAAHLVPVSQFTNCLQQVTELENTDYPYAYIITPNVVPFPRYRIGYNLSPMSLQFVLKYNQALIGAPDIWSPTVALPQGFGNTQYWTYPSSDPNSAAYLAIDTVLQPIVYAYYGVEVQ